MWEVFKLVNGQEVECSRVCDKITALEVLTEWEVIDMRRQVTGMLGYKRQPDREVVIDIREVG